MRVVGPSFLVTNKSIPHVTFSGFKGIHTIESGFMLGCSKLQLAELSSLEGLATINHCFMAEAPSLTHLKLPTTRFLSAKLKTVGNHFLRGASSLNQAQEKAFESVTMVGGYFMSESALESLRQWKIKGFERTRQGLF